MLLDEVFDRFAAESPVGVMARAAFEHATPTTLVIDRLSYWRITPGQITYVTAFGAGARSYDTENMVLEKRRDDLFRHWILGLGSGDLRIHTYGGRQQEIFVPNVLFIGTKIHAIQHMIATEPGKFGHAALE